MGNLCDVGQASWYRCRFFLFAAILCSIVCPGVRAEQAPLPPKVNLVAEFQRIGLVPVAQGDRDVCSLFAITALAEFESDRHAGGVHWRLSEEFLIGATKEATGKTGEQAMFYQAVQGLNTFGICSSNQMPYMSNADPNRKPSAAAVAESRALRQRWQVEWTKRWSVDSPVTDGELMEMKRALANGHPVACGLRWPKALQGSELLAVPPPSQVYDGHSIVLVGYLDDRSKPGGGTFIFRNSWGPAWGSGGYGQMSYAYVRAYANDALWLRFGSPESEVPILRCEAESMPILAQVKCAASGQRMDEWGAKMWSGGQQMFCKSEKGGQVELGFDVRTAGRYRVRALATAAPDFAILGAALDGKAISREFDLYAGRICPAGSLELGTFELAAGRHRVAFTANDKNVNSKNYFFGLDAIDILAADKSTDVKVGPGK